MSALSVDQRRALRQAAVAFYALPRDLAQQVAKKLDDSLLSQFATALLDETWISRGEAETALSTLLTRYQQEDSIADCTPTGVREWLDTVAEDRAEHVFEQIHTGADSPFESMPPRELAELLQVEHPMLAAVVLESIDPALASETLVELPETHRHAAALRLVYRIPISGEYLDVLHDEADQMLRERQKRRIRAMGGPAVLGGILRKVPKAVRDQITERILELDPDRSEDLDRALLEVEDLLLLSPRDMALLLQKVNRNTLLTALTMVSESVRDAVMASMTQRAAQMLAEDLESAGRRPVEEVEQAQRDIMRTMWNLVDEGQIALEDG